MCEQPWSDGIQTNQQGIEGPAERSSYVMQCWYVSLFIFGFLFLSFNYAINNFTLYDSKCSFFLLKMLFLTKWIDQGFKLQFELSHLDLWLWFCYYQQLWLRWAQKPWHCCWNHGHSLHQGLKKRSSQL